MDYYYKEFSKLQDEFYEVVHDYPLFSETIHDIDEKSLKEINELLEKNDEFYLKKAISKLEDLIKLIKDTSTNIEMQYEKFDKLAKTWEKIELKNKNEKEISNINQQVKKANSLISSHNLSDLKEANKIMETLIKEGK